MTFPIQKLREIILQMLFSYDLGHPNQEDLVSLIMSELAVSKKIALEALSKTLKIIEKKEEIDAVITQASTAYAIDRIQNVEKNVLRLGIYELLFETDIPEKVVLAEAIRMTRKFSTPESAGYINAVLDNISKNKKTE